jgi:thiamine-monophosphate kinase
VVDEFELIECFFTGRGARREDVRLGVGDDAAVLTPPLGHELLLTTDTLVAGRHFPESGFAPAALGHRALAVNLSDIAAMGGRPAWALLALTLPEVDEAWLAAFSEAFATLAERFDVALAGGNIASGPLSITVSVAGFSPTGQALRRRGAKAGDRLYVTGALGGGAAGLRALRAGASMDASEAKPYARPEPRVATGLALVSVAQAAIDISDGLAGDLAKLLAASGELGAELDSKALPFARNATLADALGPSDDYELLVAIPESELAAVPRLDCGLTCIGRTSDTPGIRLDGKPLAAKGYRHFA